MNCKHCGAQMNDNAAFCPLCGSPVEAESAPVNQPPVQQPQQAENHYQAPPAQAPAYQAPPAQAPAYQQPQYQYPNAPMYPAGGAAAIAPKKKGKKGLKVFLIIIFTIIALALLGFIFRASIARAYMGETGTYLANEITTLAKVLNIKDAKDLGINSDFTANTKITISNDDPSDSQDLSKFSISLDSAFSQKKEKGVVNATFSDGTNEGGLKLCYEKGKIGITAPGLSDKVVYIDDLAKASSKSDANVGKIVNSLAKIVRKIEKKELKDCIKTSSDKVNGKSCRVVTYTISPKDGYNIAARFLEELEKDKGLQKELKKLVATFGSMSEMTGDTSAEKLDEEFEDFLDDLSDSADKMREQAEDASDDAVLIISIASKGTTIIQRRIEFVDQYVITIDTELSGKKGALEFKMTDPNEENTYMKAELNRTTSGGKTDLSIEAFQGDSDTSVFSAELEGYKIVKNHGVAVPVFSLDVNIPSEDVKFSLSAENDDDYVITCSVPTAGDTYTVKIASTLSSKADFSDFETPEESEDSIEDFFSDFGYAFGNKFGNVLDLGGGSYGYDYDYDF